MASWIRFLWTPGKLNSMLRGEAVAEEALLLCWDFCLNVLSPLANVLTEVPCSSTLALMFVSTALPRSADELSLQPLYFFFNSSPLECSRHSAAPVSQLLQSPRAAPVHPLDASLFPSD